MKNLYETQYRLTLTRLNSILENDRNLLRDLYNAWILGKLNCDQFHSFINKNKKFQNYEENFATKDPTVIKRIKSVNDTLNILIRLVTNNCLAAIDHNMIGIRSEI